MKFRITRWRGHYAVWYKLEVYEPFLWLRWLPWPKSISTWSRWKTIEKLCISEEEARDMAANYKKEFVVEFTE